MDLRPTIISIGGNVIIRRGESGTIEEQLKNIQGAFKHIRRLIDNRHPLVITHGNGPIVGNILIRNESAKNTVPPMPLYICDADSVGGIGFMLQETIYNELIKLKRKIEVATIVTQVVVRMDDRAFKNPTKPVGPYYTREEALAISKEKGWTVMEDSMRGYRRFVASPKPVRVIEAGVIKKLLSLGVIVVAAGGGGIPVVENPDGTLKGIDAVIDKDLATAALAKEVKAKSFINLTQIDGAYLDFGKPAQRRIAKMDIKEAKTYLKKGHFLPGSMGPKIEAAIEFIEGGGKEVLITTPELLEEAMDGKQGTRIVG